jgi:DNA-binding CsgD family transcriptional regulator
MLSNYVKDPVAIALSNEVAQICQPLSQTLASKFCYHRVYYDGAEVMLSNDVKWTEHYYSAGYSMANAQAKAVFKTGFVYNLWKDLSGPDHEIITSVNQFDWHHGITLVFQHPAYYEVIGVGARHDHDQFSSFCLSNIDLLERFVVYFREKAAALIQQAEANKIIFQHPQDWEGIAQIQRFIRQSRHDERTALMEALKLYPCTAMPKHEILTQREQDCVRFLLQGKTSREMGESMFISPRTVETHLNHIKDKFECDSKIALVIKLLAH